MDLKLLGVIAFFGPITMCIFGNTASATPISNNTNKTSLCIGLYPFKCIDRLQSKCPFTRD